jgi:hypothetical protein
VFCADESDQALLDDHALDATWVSSYISCTMYHIFAFRTALSAFWQMCRLDHKCTVLLKAMACIASWSACTQFRRSPKIA